MGNPEVGNPDIYPPLPAMSTDKGKIHTGQSASEGDDDETKVEDTALLVSGAINSRHSWAPVGNSSILQFDEDEDNKKKIQILKLHIKFYTEVYTLNKELWEICVSLNAFCNSVLYTRRKSEIPFAHCMQGKSNNVIIKN